ncbi:hypothetical protein RNJ44_03011 [Nakaseomyces bracarensis]|uniref:Cytidyltransferase-like domain-containing protein n=1 Tax=Nakaseomyces bracarensis TaxID=273131 RepID=A0ABR4NYK3_9SACH
MKLQNYISLNRLIRKLVSTEMPYTSFVNDFIHHNKSFAIFGGSEKFKQKDNDSVLLVLDSSFNPPHLGHYTLIKNSVKFYQSKGITDLQILLLLSVKNADKGVKPAPFSKRMDMMQQFSKYINEQQLCNKNNSVILALTNHAKFVDKKNVIQDFIGHDSRTKIAFLVGFDTLVRIFDPKYYAPILVSEALEEFMKTVEFCCLARDHDQTTIEIQHRYVSEILDGEKEPQIPRSWGQKIHFIEFDEGVKSISSSSIRQKVLESRDQNSDDFLEFSLPTNLYEYIKKNSEIFYE